MKSTTRRHHDESPSPRALAGSADAAARGHLRGSSLLLAGRLLSLGLNFIVQVLTVRYLTKSDYGAFAWALSVVSLGASVNLLGLQRAVNRFIPMYHQRHENDLVLGTLVIVIGSIVALGLALCLVTFGLQPILADSVVSNPRSVGLLVILIALCPLQALDNAFQGVVAALASPRAIFFRRHVLGPCLKLAAVLFVLLVEGSVYLMATCYLLANAVGVLIYVWIIVGILREHGLLEQDLIKQVRQGPSRLPVREIFSFSLPLLTADAAAILKTTMAVLLLEVFRGSTDVAELRSVLPIAGLNLIALQSLKLVFTPVATRLFVRSDAKALNDLYWQSTLWIAVMTFPVFAVCFFLAEPVAVLLFGDRYSGAGILLAILSLGSYFNAATGLNTYTLQVYARVRFVSLSNVVAMLAGLVLNLALIPPHGAVGAALATTAAVIIQNVLNHAGLRWHTDVVLFQWRHWKVYLTIVAATLLLFLLRRLLDPSIAVTLILVAVASGALVGINRHTLAIAETFPELRRLPVLGRLLVREVRP